ncbi:MAG: glycosyltransferase, partial [Acidobacteriota bacterium]|nr:glycosyltransferase [Acidobacteriota bacterium]
MWLRRVQYLVQVLVWISEFRRSGVVFTRDLGVASLILQFPRRLRPPLIYESHCFSPTEAAQRSQALSTARVVSPRKQRRLMRREGRVWSGADGYIVTTTGNLAELEGRFGKRLRVAVIPNGTRLQPDRKFEALHPIPPLCVVYAGHLYPWKGVDVLLQALVKLEGVNATIIGGDAAEPDFQRLQDTSRSI